MTSRQCRHHLPALKQEVVERYEAGESPSALAVEYSVDRSLIYRWACAYRARGPAGLRLRGRPREADHLAAAVSRRPADRSPAGSSAGDADASAIRRSLAEAQAQIAALERRLGRQQLELDFFEQALRVLSAPTMPSGASASTPSSRRRRARKAD